MKIFKTIIKNILPHYVVKKIQNLKYETMIPASIKTLERKQFVFEYDDYIRASTLELISNEIYDRNIAGNVAELGVYRGDFAKLINIAFPDRKLYLFDTFAGFDARDVKIEIEKGYSIGEEDFSETSIELVLNKMQNKENCIIKKGFFPETTENINDNFAFVSLDCDLYEPIYKGLHFFYEKLNNGGYMMIHDYNNKDYDGVKAALRKFCQEKNVPYFPICDSSGSAVITKI